MISTMPHGAQKDSETYLGVYRTDFLRVVRGVRARHGKVQVTAVGEQRWR